MRCRQCERTWHWNGLEALTGGLCSVCCRASRTKPSAVPALPDGELSWRLCPHCGTRWAMADGRQVEREAGFEALCGTCWVARQHYLAVWAGRV